MKEILLYSPVYLFSYPGYIITAAQKNGTSCIFQCTIHCLDGVLLIWLSYNCHYKGDGKVFLRHANEIKHS